MIIAYMRHESNQHMFTPRLTVSGSSKQVEICSEFKSSKVCDKGYPRIGEEDSEHAKESNGNKC